MAESEPEEDFFLCTSWVVRTPEQVARREAAWREAELADFRARRAARIAELGLGSHRKQP
jgi:hypothetical protein